MSAPAPRVLIADDDPISLRFLRGALSALGAHCTVADDGAAALRAAERESFDLLILDLRMPVLGGAELLHALRALGVRARAVATSAELDGTTIARLHAAGFADVIAKPVSLARLAQAAQMQSPTLAAAAVAADVATESGSAVWLDDARALATLGGDTAALRGLRLLLAAELDALECDLHARAPALPGDFADRLHRLRASCGFCGAPALAAATRSLQLALDGADVARWLEAWEAACARTRRALGDQLSALGA